MNPHTKAQSARFNYLEKRGYDFRHHNSLGLPVFALVREGKPTIWVRVNRDGSFQPE